MLEFPPTVILRHRKENLKKCSLRGLEHHPHFQFYTYPWKQPKPSLAQYVILTLDAPLLSHQDANKGIFLIDSTWRYADKMLRSLPSPFEMRSLPSIKTAYPRRQEDCPNPAQGLASIEALYLAFTILGRETSGLLDEYHWKGEFLENIFRGLCGTQSPLPSSDKIEKNRLIGL